jgi:hypothetical protein
MTPLFDVRVDALKQESSGMKPADVVDTAARIRSRVLRRMNEAITVCPCLPPRIQVKVTLDCLTGKITHRVDGCCAYRRHTSDVIVDVMNLTFDPEQHLRGGTGFRLS